MGDTIYTLSGQEGANNWSPHMLVLLGNTF